VSACLVHVKVLGSTPSTKKQKAVYSGAVCNPCTQEAERQEDPEFEATL
jgi:hypothetical protein